MRDGAESEADPLHYGDLRMQQGEGKFITSVKVGPKGQIIVPKEVRDMFHIQPGDMLLMLADMEQGIAIQTFDSTSEMFEKLFPAKKVMD